MAGRPLDDPSGPGGPMSRTRKDFLPWLVRPAR